MKYVCVAIFDSAADAFSRPEFFPAAPVAVRSFRDAVNEPKGQFQRHPDDFELFELGSWSDEKGVFECHKEPIRLARGKDLIGG